MEIKQVLLQKQCPLLLSAGFYDMSPKQENFVDVFTEAVNYCRASGCKSDILVYTDVSAQEVQAFSDMLLAKIRLEKEELTARTERISNDHVKLTITC